MFATGDGVAEEGMPPPHRFPIRVVVSLAWLALHIGACRPVGQEREALNAGAPKGAENQPGGLPSGSPDSSAGPDASGSPDALIDTGEARCGSGVQEAGQACVDGNDASGDGCSTSCQTETGSVCSSSSASRCTHSSCAGMSGTECNGGDCCASAAVTGGTFTQGDGTAAQQAGNQPFQSTVATFRLDDFEVTVARFRAFVNDYDRWHGADGNPMDGDGANPNVDNSGWSSSWSTLLPATAGSLKTNLQCDPTYETWAETGHDTLPINCVSWYEAAAFCLWDSGRLPTESEWEFAAVGGPENWTYPWGNTPVLTSSQGQAYAAGVYLGGGTPSQTPSDILVVGSRPAGLSAYGQYDLIGSMWEWTLDWFAGYPSGPAVNYAKTVAPMNQMLGDPAIYDYRVTRGGGFLTTPSVLVATARGSLPPANRADDAGLRCARTP
jgi:formylglycine-generating enzyme